MKIVHHKAIKLHGYGNFKDGGDSDRHIQALGYEDDNWFVMLPGEGGPCELDMLTASEAEMDALLALLETMFNRAWDKSREGE